MSGNDNTDERIKEKPIEFKNPIWVAGQIDNKDFFTNFTRRFSELMIQTKEGDEITIYLNSPGGEAHTALGIYDLLIQSNRNTIGIVAGIAHSGASLILQACRKRIMTKNSKIMLHKSSVQVGGYVDNAQEALNTFKKLDEKYYEIYSKRSGRNVDKISEMAQRDKYFDPEEALVAGLIDEII